MDALALLSRFWWVVLVLIAFAAREWVLRNYAGIEIAKALSASGFKLVPDVLVAGGGGEGGNSLVSVLLANLIRDGLKKPT
jgi:hypothetical protein